MQYHQQQQINNKKQTKGAPNNMKLIDKEKQKSLQNSSSQSNSLQISQLQQKRLMTDQSQSQISNRLILFQQLQNNSSNCLFCNKCRKSSQFSQMISTALYSKYSASQNYYFTKDINDILAGQRTSAVIRLKDVQAYDDQEEFLNRLYLFHEYDNKIKRLTEYYKFHRDIARLFMQPITNTLNKFHDKKRRIYYIQITRMLKEKENVGKKDEKDEDNDNVNEKNVDMEGQKNEKERTKDNELDEQNCEIQKNKNKQKNKEDKDKKNEKNFNIKDKSNGADFQKSFDMNERFLAPLDDIDESTKSVQCNTLQDLNNKLNDILMNSTRSMQSYFFDQDVSQSIGNLSNFLNHLKVQNSQQQISMPQQLQKFSENNNAFVGKETNSLINFDPQQFQNLLLNQDQKNIQPTLLKNQLPLSSLQSNEQDSKNTQNLIANSQSIKQFLKKDSFLKKSQNEQQQPIQQNQQFPIPITSENKNLTENSLLQQMLKNNSPQSNQKVAQELQKQNLGSKTDRGHYNQKSDEKLQNQIQKINQDMIQLNQNKMQSGQQSAYSSIGNKEGWQNIKDNQKELNSGYSNQQNKNAITQGNQIQLNQFDDQHVSHLKTQSLNQGGFKINLDNKGNVKKAGNSGNSTLNQGISNQKISGKYSARQPDGKNNEYPQSGMSEFIPSERNSLNSLQQSINSIIKQASKGVGSSTSSSEQSSIGLQSKLVSNTSSKYSSSQNRQDSKNPQQQQVNNNKTPQQQKQQDLIVNKKINNLVLSDHQNSKKQSINSDGSSISQIPQPTNSVVQQIILNQQSQQTKQQDNYSKSNLDKSYNDKQGKQYPIQDNQYLQQDNQYNQQEKQKSLSQQLSQQFQQQFSQQLQNYQRSQIQELQQYSALQRQLSQGKNEYKNDDEVQCAPYTDRSQYNKKNNSQNQGYQKTLSARDKEQTSKGLIDLNAQKLKTQQAVYSQRDNQFDLQDSYLRNNTDHNQINYLISNQQIQNPSQIQIYQVQNTKQQNEFKNIQQNANMQNVIQGNVVKSSFDNIKSYSNLVNFGQNSQHIPTHIRTQTLESYRENNLNSQENTYSNSQSQQASRNQSKSKSQSQQYPLPPTSQFSNSSQIQSFHNHAQLSRQGSQQKNQISAQNIQQNPQQYQQQQQQNENVYFKQSTHEQNPSPQIQNHLRMQSNIELNQIQNRQQEYQQNQNQKQNEQQQQSQNNQIYLKKSLSNYKFENIGELKQIYKEVQKRTAAMFSKHQDVQKNAQNVVTITNQSIQDIQNQKSNSQRQKNNYYTKSELQTHKKGSLTQRGFQNSQDQSSSKESPRIHRIQKSDQSHLQNNSLMKQQNTDREQNSRRVSSQIKSSNNFNNSSSQIFTGGQVQIKQQQPQQSQVNLGGNINIGASQLQMVSHQVQQNSREQALTTTQKKLQYKQQASKNSSEVNSRMIHSNPNADFNKTQYILSYNNSVNNTNIFAPSNYNQPNNNQITTAAQSAYSSVINNLGSNSQLIVSNNSQLQNNANSQQNSSKKILDKIKHTRINSMNAAASLQQSQNSNQFINIKSTIPSQTFRQQSTEYGKQMPLNNQQQKQIQTTNPTEFLITTQDNSKKIHHKYNKSEADSLIQFAQQQNNSQSIPSQTNLGQNQLININQNGNKQQLQKQAQQFQGSQSHQNLHEMQNNLIGYQQIPQTQQLSLQPSQQQFQQKTNINALDNKKMTQQVSSRTHQTSQNSQSPERNSYNSLEKKNNQQYFTYANNNIINIFVNSHQENGKTIQSNNLINNHAQNLQQNIHQMINTQINLNKNVTHNLQQPSQKTQNSPPKKTSSKLVQRSQPDSYTNLKF